MANIDLSTITGNPVVSYYDPAAPAAGDMFWSMATSREGCYIANGADYAQADEPELFAALGTAFNTQINPTTGAAWAAPAAGRFRVPDMRGVVPRGAGTPVNGDALSVGGYQDDQLQGHWHRVRTSVGNILPGINSSGSGSANNISAPATAANANPVLEAREAITNGAEGIPRTGSETRGKARGGNWFIRRFNASYVAYGAGLATANTPGLVKSRIPTTALSADISGGLSGTLSCAYSMTDGVVTLRLGTTSSQTAGTGPAVISLANMPSSLWPMENVATQLIGIKSNSALALLANLSPSGTISVYADLGGGTWASQTQSRLGSAQYIQWKCY